MWEGTYPEDFLIPEVRGQSFKSSKNVRPSSSRPHRVSTPTRRESSASAHREKDASASPKVSTDSPKIISEKKGDVIIHVFDENRNAKRDFYCRRQLLIAEMAYFTQHIQDKKPEEIIEIDVHCDVQVFEWLMAYVTQKEVTLEPRTVISILISSHFLKMSTLESQCLSYIHKNINQVVTVPIDMRCIQPALVQNIERHVSLASLFSIQDLSQVNDPKDRLESQIYQYKMLALMDNSSGQKLLKCSLCSRVLPQSFSMSSCDSATITLDYEGRLLSLHKFDKSFNINGYIVSLFMGCQSWKRVYWRLWGIKNSLECSVCDRVFLCHEYVRCRRHLCEPVFSHAEPGRGAYECCNQTHLSFMPFRLNQGCHYYAHVPKSSGGQTYSLFQKNKHHILWKTEEESECLQPVAIQLDLLALSQRPFFNKWSKSDLIPRSLPDPFLARSRPGTASMKSVTQFDQRRQDAKEMQKLAQQLVQLRSA